MSDSQSIDARYKAFPPFSDWAKKKFQFGRWKSYKSDIEMLKSKSQDSLEKARRIVMRTAAVETGAIEKLYETDRGFTETIAIEAATWQAASEKKGSDVRNLIISQLDAYNHIIDAVTNQVKITEFWIREIHAKICHAQKTYHVQTAIGPQNQELLKGEYKTQPNHVRKKDGEVHAYAPVDLTPAEMYRLCKEMRSKEFATAHPIMQASYVHYAFVCIHPFADGNGRVARALASVFTYRAAWVPILVMSEKRSFYFNSLEQADSGNYELFIRFIGDCCLDALLLVKQSLRAVKTIDAKESLANLENLYTTKGGYTYEQVDKAAEKLNGILISEFSTVVKKSDRNKIKVHAAREQKRYKPVFPNYRLPVAKRGDVISVSFSVLPPLKGEYTIQLFTEIPKDCGKDDDIFVRNLTNEVVLQSRVDEVEDASLALLMRCKMLAQQIVAEGLQELQNRVTNTLDD